MSSIRKIDNIFLVPNPSCPEFNICSIYYRDEANHKWLLYADMVEKSVEIEQLASIARAEINFHIDVRPVDSTVLFTIHDLETNITSNLYNDLKALLDKYRK